MYFLVASFIKKRYNLEVLADILLKKELESLVEVQLGEVPYQQTLHLEYALTHPREERAPQDMLFRF